MASTLLFSRAFGSSVSSAASISRQQKAHSSAGRLRGGKALAFVIGQLGGRQLVLRKDYIGAIALFIV